MTDKEQPLKQVQREEIADQYKWNLAAIYADEELWEQDFTQVKALADELALFQGSLAESSDRLLAALLLQEQIELLFGKVFVYARMRKDEDNRVSTYQSLTDRAQGLAVQVSSALAFIVPEIIAIPDDVLTAFMEEEKLQLYQRLIDEIRRVKPHTLSADQEALLAATGEMAQAADNIFTMLNNADIKFPTMVDEAGQEVELTKGRYSGFMESANREIRREAFTKLYSSYQGLINTLATTLNHEVKKNIFYAKARKYESALAAALFADNIPVTVYEQLVTTVNDHLDLLHRYVALRKEVLALDEIHMYDLYAPLIDELELKVGYEDAANQLAEALTPLGEEYINDMKRGLASHWVDVYENEGKTSGAYSWGTYGTDPYILLNYQDKVNDLFTLAHEIGHSMHSYYSNSNQPQVYANYRIFVAEVASTLNEALLMHYLLENTTDKRVRLYYLNHYLEQFRATLYRQTMFAEFELLIHQQAEQGAALTAAEFNQLYRDLNLKYYGPDMVVDEQIDLEWARIPHFYMNFYVYKYATGFSAAISLAKQILTEGEPAVERYLNFLKSGGSDYPIDLLRAAGVDMNSSQPIEDALAVFSEILDEMETLLLG